MKLWKRFAAAVLAAVFTMAMLTACGGSGELPIVEDTEQAKNVATWVQEALERFGYKDVNVDETLSPMIEGGLMKAVAYLSAQNAKKDDETIQGAYNDLCATLDLNFARTGKTGYVFATLQGTGAIEENNIKGYIESQRNSMLATLKEAGVENPASIAVGVATQGKRHFILLVVSD